LPIRYGPENIDYYCLSRGHLQIYCHLADIFSLFGLLVGASGDLQRRNKREGTLPGESRHLVTIVTIVTIVTSFDKKKLR